MGGPGNRREGILDKGRYPEVKVNGPVVVYVQEYLVWKIKWQYGEMNLER